MQLFDADFQYFLNEIKISVSSVLVSPRLYKQLLWGWFSEYLLADYSAIVLWFLFEF